MGGRDVLFSFFVTINLVWGQKYLARQHLGTSKVRHFAWSCQMKQKALRDHGDYAITPPKFVIIYATEIVLPGCRPKRKGSSEWTFPLIRRLISSFLIISIMVVFVVVMMLKMECNKSDLWAYTNPAGKTSLERKGNSATPNPQLVRPESRISAVNKRSGRSSGGPWKVSWFDSRRNIMKLWRVNELRDGFKKKSWFKLFLECLNGNWDICNTIILIYYEVIFWLKDTYGRKRPESFLKIVQPCEERSDAAVGFRWKREHPTVQEVPPVRLVLGNLKGISLQVGIIQSLGIGVVLHFRGEEKYVHLINLDRWRWRNPFPNFFSRANRKPATGGNSASLFMSFVVERLVCSCSTWNLEEWLEGGQLIFSDGIFSTCRMCCMLSTCRRMMNVLANWKQWRNGDTFAFDEWNELRSYTHIRYIDTWRMFIIIFVCMLSL